MIHVVLHEPEIPSNTGNIGRTCVAAGASLHLIRPFGFHFDDKLIKKAGLDYWPYLNLKCYDGFEEFISSAKPEKLFCVTTKATLRYTEIEFGDGAFFLFGKESAGLPLSIRERYSETCVRIPMREEARSLNLANSVSIIVYEALRQNNFHSLR